MLKGSSKKITITPPIGLRMSGFSDRTHGSVGILHQLYANVLVLDDEKTKVALVTLDLISVDKELTRKVRDIVSQNTTIPHDAILLCASHTHSGPEACRFGDMGKISRRIEPNQIDTAYNTLLPDLIAQGIIWADAHLEPVNFGVKQSQLLGLGSNRIDKRLYVDNTVTVFRFDRLTGDPLALFTQYACHPTILDSTNYLYSGDFISYYQESIEKIFPDCVAFYAQGCAGNVSTRHNRMRSGQQEARRMGTMLAGEVTRDAMQAMPCENVNLSFAVEPMTLKIRKFESDEECERRIKLAQADYDFLIAQNAPENIQRTAKLSFNGAKRYFALKKSIDIKKINIEMQRISIGDWNIITTPAETFGEIGRDIRKLDPSQHTLVTGYSNGYVGYIPTKKTFESQLGYEIGSAIIAENTEKILVATAKKLLTK